MISQLTGQYACYTCSIIAIWRHHRMSSATRTLSVMNRMQELQYHGDTGKLKLYFIERAAEVFQSQVTLEYWMMNCAFQSFEGKNMQIQSRIVEDINNKDIVCPDMSVDKLVNEYAEYLATLNAGQVINKVSAQKEVSSGHAAIDRHAQPRDEERRKPKPRSNRPSGVSRPRGPSVPQE